MSSNTSVNVEEGLFNCTVYNTVVPQMDNIRCFSLNLAVTLSIIEINSICMGLCVLIILISIFGGIKENYRCFILNQAFWDFFISYENRCNNQIAVLLPAALPTMNEKCIYANFDLKIFRNFFTNIFHSNTFASLLLLAFTRFMAVYFTRFYKHLTCGRRVWYTIFAYNFVIISMHSYFIIDFLMLERQSRICEKPANSTTCNIACVANLTKRCIENDSTLSTFTEIALGFRNVVNLARPILFLLLPIISAILILAKISKQATFQFRHNRKMFFGSFRVSAVIILQVFITSIVFVLQSIDTLKKIVLLGSAQNSAWLFGLMGLTMPIALQMFLQIRIFIECCLVLSVMTGYREAIIAFSISVFFVLRHPIETIRSLRYHWRTSRKLSIKIHMPCQARVNSSEPQ